MSNSLFFIMFVSDTSMENNSKQQNTNFENVKLQMYIDKICNSENKNLWLNSTN